VEIEEARFVNKDKYMWDGEIYETREDAEKKKAKYEGNNFQVQLFEEEGKYLVYTRRVVTEIVLEGQPPA